MLLAGFAHPGPAAFLREYLGADDQAVPFVGRLGDLQALTAWLGSDDDRAIVAAAAGGGKSALLVRFAVALDAAGHDVAWVPVSLRFGTHRSQTLDALLTARLGALAGSSGHWKDELARDFDGPLLVVLDGLDELQDEAFLDALVALRLGRGVRLLVAARTLLDRDAEGWAARLAWPAARLSTLLPLSLLEITAALPADRAAEAASLLERTGGDPLLLRLCLEALGQGEPLPASTDPLSLVGAWWEAQRLALPTARGAVAKRALAALGAACGVVPWDVLAAVTGDDEDALRAALRPFGRFVRDVPAQGATFAHPRFADVARETMPTELASMQARFGALVVTARAEEEPSPYWLHFGLAHLAAADAPDEAFAQLLTASSMLAWRRLEGDLHGLRDEAEALLDRTARTVVASACGAAGLPAVLGALTHLVFANTLVSLLQDIEESMTPALRTAQVSTGLRSADAALASVLAVRYEQDSDYELDDLLWPLLPLLPDEVLPGLLSTGPRARFPRKDIVRLLCSRGLPALAYEVFRQEPMFLGRELVLLAPHLSPEQIAAGAEAAVSSHRPLIWESRLAGAWAVLPFLPEDRRDAVRERIWQEALSVEEPSERELLAAISVCRDHAASHARRGEDAAALNALEQLLPVFARGSWTDEQEQVWEAVVAAADALAALSPSLGDRIEQWVDALTCALAPEADGWPTLVLWRARPDWLARGEEAAEAEGFLLALARRERGEEGHELRLPEAWRPRAETAVVAKLRAELLEGDVPWRHDLETYTLRDREAFVELLPSLVAGAATASERRAACVCRMLAQQGGLDGDPRVVAALEAIADRGGPVWEITAWERIWQLERRRALVMARLAEPPWLPEREHRAAEVKPGSRRREPRPESQGTRRLRKQLALAIGAYTREALATLLVCAPAREHEAILDRLFFSRDSVDYIDRYYLAPTSDQLLRLIDDRDLRERAARHLLAGQDEQSLRLWPSVAIASLPAEERLPAERTLLAHLLAHQLELPAGTPDWALIAWAEEQARAGSSWPAVAKENGAVLRVPALHDRLLDAAFGELDDAAARGDVLSQGSNEIFGALLGVMSREQQARAARQAGRLPWPAVDALMSITELRPVVVDEVLADLRDEAAAEAVRFGGFAWLLLLLNEPEIAAVLPWAARMPDDLAAKVSARLWRLLTESQVPSEAAATSAELLAHVAARATAPFDNRLYHVLWSLRAAPLAEQAEAVLALRDVAAWGMRPPSYLGFGDEPAADDLRWPLARLGRSGLAVAVLVRLLAIRPPEEHRIIVVALWPAIPEPERAELASLVEAAVIAGLDEPWTSTADVRSMTALVSEETAKKLWETRPQVLEARLPKDAREEAALRGLMRAYAVFGVVT